MARLYSLIAKILFQVGYFKGSFRIQAMLSRYLPLKLNRVKHPLGFSWEVGSRESLNTYLASCEPYTTKIILSQADNLDTFICVGANQGWYPLVVGARNIRTRILAFECNSSTFRELCQNISINKNKCELYQLAIGDYDGGANLYIPNKGNQGMSTIYPIGKQVSDFSTIERIVVSTLDTVLLESRNLGRVLLLMDIEGSEMKALQGAINFLQNYSPIIIIEINPQMLVAADSSVTEVFEYLKNLNYHPYWIDERGQLCRVSTGAQLPHLHTLPPHSGANYLFVKAGESWVSDYVRA